MHSRLTHLQKLLANDGTILVQLDDNEIAYCRVMMDEFFGRQNFINQVSVKMKQTAGASGGGEDKKLKKNIEYILIYAKNIKKFESFNPVYDETDEYFTQLDPPISLETDPPRWGILIVVDRFWEQLYNPVF